MVALLGLPGTSWSQSSRPPLPKLHRHIGVSRSTVGVDVPEFSMAETSVEAGLKRENHKANRPQTYAAFTVTGARLFVSERKTGKIYEIQGLPLGWRPFSDLSWAHDDTLMFDRWSEPHYGVHYSINVKSKRLMAAVPFPDQVYLRRQRLQRKAIRPRHQRLRFV